ncbi:MAG: hypothetical protein J5781_06160, partial [Clostridia bacterium]|nr:hypothetical protein [Clostridia bacterium]
RGCFVAFIRPFQSKKDYLLRDARKGRNDRFRSAKRGDRTRKIQRYGKGFAAAMRKTQKLVFYKNSRQNERFGFIL